MTAPRLPSLSSTEESFGPPSTIPSFLKFNDVPYAPFSKGDKLGKVADWASDPKDGKDQRKQQHRGFKDPYHAYGANSASFFTNEDNMTGSSFSIVDSNTKPAPKPRVQNAVLKTRGAGAGGGPGSSGRGGGTFRGRGGGRGGAVVNVGSAARQSGRRHGWKDYDKPQKNREASVVIGNDWELKQSIGFNDLQKLSFDVKKGDDIADYGYVNHYNRQMEKPGSANQRLKPLDRTVFNVSASDDPVIQEYASKNTGLVYTTDTVLSLLMTCTKSANPWDIVINKKDGKVFFDKRDGGPLDFVTVDENSADAPMDFSDKESNINSATNLGVEATYINQNFIANAVATAQKYDFSHPNPFGSGTSEEPLLSNGYRYKKYNLAASAEDEPIDLVVRTQLDAVSPGGGSAGADQFMTIQALNEYGGSNGQLEWKNKFVNQRGAIVAAEMKNNLAKLSRWTIQSILAGANLMKIGFVSRASPKDNSSHVIVGVLGRDPTQFATQLNVNMLNGWGIVKSLVNIVSSFEDGKYVLMKDPNSAQIRIYSVPSNAFEESK